MPILRIQGRKHGYVVMQSACLEDARLSWKARGILAYLLSKPDNWTLQLSDLVAHSRHEGPKAIRAALKELVACGYARLQTLRSETGGKFLGREYTISEIAILTDIPQSGTSVERKFRKAELPQKAALVLPEEEVILEGEVKNEKITTLSAQSAHAEIQLPLLPGIEKVTGLWIVETYNRETPPDHPKHDIPLPPLRQITADKYAKNFPDPSFWHAVFAEVGRSPWLRGQVASNGHRPVKRNLFWMLQGSQDKTQENCVKVYEGNYRDEASTENQQTLTMIQRIKEEQRQRRELERAQR